MKPTDTYISVCGNAKHGKSTLAGRLLYEFKAVSDSQLEGFRKQAEASGKDYNAFSIMFMRHRSSTASRKTGIADDQSRSVFPERGNIQLPDGRSLGLIDTPGFSRFLDNIVYGIYLSDLAVIVVEASSGVQSGTVAVARILASFSIPTVAVLVTKMDLVDYSQTRFQQVSHQVRETILPLLPNNKSHAPEIIPISALTGAGFDTQNARLPWYSGITPLDALRESEKFVSPNSLQRVRFAVEGGREIYSPPGVGTVIVGLLELGKLQTRTELLLEPASTINMKPITIRVRSLQRARSITERQMQQEDSVSAHAIVAVATSDLSHDLISDYLRHGGILGHPEDKPTVATEIMAELIFFESSTVYHGKEFIIHPNASTGMTRIAQIEARGSLYDLSVDEYDSPTGEVIKAKLVFSTPLCIEQLEEFHRLTRFVLREENRVIGCGRCTQVLSNNVVSPEKESPS